LLYSYFACLPNNNHPQPTNQKTTKPKTHKTKQKHFMLGRITTDGRLSGRLRAELTDWAAARLQMQLSGDREQSNVAADLDVRGSDWNAQLKFGNPGFYGALAVVVVVVALCCVCIAGLGCVRVRVCHVCCVCTCKL
jgi:hypothetical protein